MNSYPITSTRKSTPGDKQPGKPEYVFLDRHWNHPRYERNPRKYPLNLKRHETLAKILNVCADVHRCAVLSQRQIFTLHFESLSATQDLMQRAYHNGIVDRLVHTREALYVLDRSGAALLEEHNQSVQWGRNYKQRKELFLRHTLGINDFMIFDVLRACRKNNYGLIKWATERQLKDPGVSVPIATTGERKVPDAYFVVSTPRGYAHFFLEHDCATETLGAMAVRYRAYRDFFHSGQYQTNYKTNSIHVLTTVDAGEQRTLNLKARAEQVLSKQDTWFWFARSAWLTFDSVFTHPVWLQANTRASLPLID